MSTTDALPEAVSASRGSFFSPREGEREAQRRRLADLAVILLPTLLAAGLCLCELTTRSLWLDEAATVAIASQHGAALGSALAHDGGNMLAYYALLHVLIGLLGSGAFVIRFPSAVAAVVGVALVSLLGRRLFGRRTALVAGVLTGVSLSLVYWGQDARGYVPMIALIVGSFLAFQALLDEHTGWGPWLAYVGLTTAAVYTGLEAALVVPAQLLALLWRRDRASRVLTATAITAACCVPLAVLAASRGSGQLFWIPKPSLRILDQVVQALTSSGLQPSFHTTTSTALIVLTLLILGLGAGRLGRLLWMARAGGPAGHAGADATDAHDHRAVAGAAVVLSWLLVPGLLALLESTVGQSIFQARYLLVSLPAVSLLLAWTICGDRVPRLVALVALTALIVLRALQVFPAYGVSPENWRAATSYVVDHARVGDCAAFYPLDNRQAFRYYLSSPAIAPRSILPSLAWSQVRPFVEDYASLSPRRVAQLPTTCSRVWLVASHEGRVGGPPVSRGNYLRLAQMKIALRLRYPRLHTRSFGDHGIVAVTLYSS